MDKNPKKFVSDHYELLDDIGNDAHEVQTHSRFRRVVSSSRNKTRKYNATDSLNSSMDYPEGFFIPPGATESPEVYDYDVKKFNRTYLTQASWRNPLHNKTKKYKKKEHKKKGVIHTPVDIDDISPVKVPKGIITSFGL